MEEAIEKLDETLETGFYETPFSIDMLSFSTKNHYIDHVRKVLSLPKPIQGIMTDFSTAEYIEDKLGTAFGLNTDQKSELTRIIRDILLADAFWGDFPTLVSSRLGIDANTANQMVKAIASELFAPAVEDIKTMQKNKFSDRISQSGSNQAQPTQQNASVEQGNVINLRDRNNGQ